LARGFRFQRSGIFRLGRFTRRFFFNGLNRRWYFWSSGFGAYVPADDIDDYAPSDDDPDSEDDDPADDGSSQLDPPDDGSENGGSSDDDSQEDGEDS
jgi:hypothetical protein